MMESISRRAATDIEERAEYQIDSAVAHSAQSNRHLFLAGYYASKVYGKYKDFATKAIADRAGRQVSSVENWVHAYRCFATISQRDCKLARKLRRSLSMTHFLRCYEAAQKYNLTADQQLYFLSLIAANKAGGEPYGPEALEHEIDVELRYAGVKPDRAVDWRYHWTRLRKPLEQLASFDGELPQDIKKRTLELLALFDDSYYDVV